MPVFHITSPDGAEYEITAPEGATEQDAIQYAQSQHAAPAQTTPVQPLATTPAKPNLGETVLEQGLQGATFGFGDELTDRLAAGAASVITGQPYKDLLQQQRGTTTARLNSELEQRPVASIASNIAGGLALGQFGGATKAGAAAGSFLRSGNAAARIGKGIASGAASGALYGAGTGQEEDRAGSALSGGIAGGVIGGLLPAAGAALNKLNTKTFVPDSEEMRAAPGALFKKAEAEGGNLAPESADAFRNRVMSHLSLDGEAKLYANNPVADRLVSNLGDYMGKPMSFATAKAIDEALGDLAYGTMNNSGKLDATGKKFLDLQGELRSHMEGVDGSDTIREARKMWSASLRMREIERILERAKGRDQPVTIIKNGFNALLQRGDKLKGYSTEEIKAIQKAAKTGMVTGALRMAGSGLVPYVAAGIGGAGGVPGSMLGGLAGYAIKEASKAGATALQEGRAANVARAISDRAGTTQVTNRMRLPSQIQALLLMPPPTVAPSLSNFYK